MGPISICIDLVSSASCVLMHKNPQGCTKVHGTQISIDRSEDVFVQYPVCVISVAVLRAV